jgi:hypothetical protein
MRVVAAVALALALLLVPAALAAGPTISYTITSGTQGDNGWYRSAVTAKIDVAGAADTSCPVVKTFRVSGDSLSCTATDGTSTIQFQLQFKIDTDAPAVTSSAAARAPDRNGWFNHAVTVAFGGTDATSGIATCSSVNYGGPDSATAAVSGTCQDNAGNVSAASSFPLKFDATAPSLARVALRFVDGAAMLTWKRTADTASIEVTRSPGRRGKAPSAVYRGDGTRFRDASLKPGIAYRYTLTSSDRAGNRAITRVRAQVRALYAPAPGAKVRAGAVLHWLGAKQATYYNVQLFRNGRKVMTAWPLAPKFKLPRSWAYEGHRYRLARGTYRWYVWPGIGDRAQAKYGRMLGGSFFRVI